MIVVDTNVLAYMSLPGDMSESVQAVWKFDRWWAAPFLWRSEFRNVLATHLKRDLISMEDADLAMRKAEALVKSEYAVPSGEVLRLAHRSGCSAYDCEYVVLAQGLETHLVTNVGLCLES